MKVAVLEDEKIPYIAPPEHLIRAADGGQVPLLMPRDTLPRRGARQAAQLSGLLSSTSPAASTPRSSSICSARKPASPLREPAPGARRPEVRARAHVLHDLADGAAGGHLGRAVVRRPVRGADPPPDQRGPAGDARQPQGRAADPARRGRSAPPVDELQHHDARSWSASAPTSSPPTTQLTERRRFMEAVLSGVSAGVIGLDRQRPHHARQPLGARSCWASTAPSSSATRSPRRYRSSRPAGRSRRAQGPAAAPGHAHHQRRGAQLLRARDARGAGRGGLRLGADLRRRHRAGRPRSARRPGPTSPAASPTRSRTR